MLELLGVNVASVVIGALFLIIALAWVDALESAVKYYFFVDERLNISSKHSMYKHIVSALFITLASSLLIVVTYMLYQNNNTGLDTSSSIMAGSVLAVANTSYSQNNDVPLTLPSAGTQ